MRKFLTTIMAITLLMSASISAKKITHFQTFEDNVQVIDVRTDAEFKNGHHPNALHVPLTKILDGKGFDSLDRTKPVVLYCKSGGRSEQAKNYLEAQGFTNVRNLGGISDLIIRKPDQK